VQKGFWAAMHVVFQTPSAVEIRRAVKEFIEFAARYYGGGLTKLQRPGQTVFPLNDRAGGGGSFSAVGPHFIYVLRSRG
jgi:hypothetical protein